MLAASDACGLRMWHITSIVALLVTMIKLLQMAEKSSYMAISIIWMMPKLLDWMHSEWTKLLATAPSTHENVVIVESRAPIAKALSNWLSSTDAGTIINGVAVESIDFDKSPVSFAYDYWKAPWTIYVIARTGEYHSCSITMHPTWWQWIRDSCATYDHHIIRIKHDPREWNGVFQNHIEIAASTKTTLLRFSKFVMELYGDQDAIVQSRVDRKTPIDIVSAPLDEPLLYER